MDEVTVINDKYILYNGSKYRRLKNKTIKKLNEKEKEKRAIYMKSYRKKLAWRLKYMQGYCEQSLLENQKFNFSRISIRL